MTDPQATKSETLSKVRPKPHRALLTSFPVVLDACVLSNPTIRDFVLWAADLALFRPIWSKDILAEVSRTLEKFGVEKGRIDYLISKMNDSFPEAEVNGYDSLIPAMDNDPKDRHVLAAAIIGKAQMIVTSNQKHFPKASLAPYKIEACTPDDFLRDLLDMDKERMLTVLQTMAEKRTMPPKTIDELLEALERNRCSGFAADLRQALGQQYADK